MSENQEPNINNNQEEGVNPQARGFISNDMADFSFLIGTILDYYDTTDSRPEEGEDWKPRHEMVDEDIDEEVKKAFRAKLSKHQ